MAKRGPQVFQISGARTGLTEDVRGRQRRYIISMSVRTLSVLLTVVLWNVERPLAWVSLVLGMLLPYVAVVIANAGRENAPVAPNTAYVPPPVLPMLEAASVETGAERAAAAGAPAASAASDGTAAPTASDAGEREPEPVAEV